MTESTDAARPLRETVAEAMHRAVSYFTYPNDGGVTIHSEVDDQTIDGFGFMAELSQAAIAAMVTALLSDEAVEAAYEALFNRHVADEDMSHMPEVLTAALRRIGAMDTGGER